MVVISLEAFKRFFSQSKLFKIANSRAEWQEEHSQFCVHFILSLCIFMGMHLNFDVWSEEPENVFVSPTWVKCTNFHVSVLAYLIFFKRRTYDFYCTMLGQVDSVHVQQERVELRMAMLRMEEKKNGIFYLVEVYTCHITGHLIYKNKSHELNQQQENGIFSEK